MAENEAEAGTSSEAPKLKFPRAVAFIIVNEICERFAYYGLRTVLTMYFTEVLLYSIDSAAVMFHFFVMTCYFFPLVGAVIADSWLGKFRTIWYLSLVYATGSVVLSFISGNYGKSGGSNPAQEAVSILGLVLIAIGTGGIKPCVSAFGGDQFKIPEQNLQLDRFFAIFYFAINVGSVLSTVLTPIFREDVKCFGDDFCYPLAFGVPAVFMAIAVVVFVAGKRYYIIKPPMGNMCVLVTKCIASAIWNRRTLRKAEPQQRWIDYANSKKYDKELRDDIVYLLRVLLLFLPLPVFWALFDQQGSRWTVQAARMDGSLGSLGSVKPDQMLVANPLLVMLLLPLMQFVGYPLLGKIHLRTPLQKITVGGILAAVAFFISALLEWQVEEHSVSSRQTVHFKLSNQAPCGIRLKPDSLDNEIDVVQITTYPMASIKDHGSFNVSDSEPCMSDKKLILRTDNGGAPFSHLTDSELSLAPNSKSRVAPRLAFVFEDGIRTSIELHPGRWVKMEVYKGDGDTEILVGEYSMTVDSKGVASSLSSDSSAVNTLTVSDMKDVRLVMFLLPRSTVHMFWQLPQYFVMSLAEVMVSVTGLEFSFTQASPNMKSVLTSVWLLTVAFGDLLDMTVVQSKIVKSQIWEHVMFACLMLLVMAIFAFIAKHYKYREGTAPERFDEKGNRKGEGQKGAGRHKDPEEESMNEEREKAEKRIGKKNPGGEKLPEDGAGGMVVGDEMQSEEKNKQTGVKKVREQAHEERDVRPTDGQKMGDKAKLQQKEKREEGLKKKEGPMLISAEQKKKREQGKKI